MRFWHMPVGPFVLAAAVLLQQGCRSVQAIPGQRLAMPEASGGQWEDFSKKITSHLFENGMMVGVGNDDRYLYIFFTPDIRHRRRLPGRVQLTLWLDENGGRARRLGLLHVSDPQPPGGPANENGPEAESDSPGGAPEGGTPSRGSVPPDPGKRTLLKIIDRSRGRETFIAADGSLGPAVRLAADWGDYAYQLRIPLQAAADGVWPGIRPTPGKAIGIGLLWRRIPFPGSKGMTRGGPPGGRPDRGGEPAGPPPGMEGGPGMGVESPPGKRSIWIRTLLVNG